MRFGLRCNARKCFLLEQGPLEDDGLAITADHEGLRIYENQ